MTASATRGVIRLGVVGTGWISYNHVLPACRNVSALVVTALADTDRGALRRCGTIVPEAAHYPSAEALIQSGTVDAIYVATPNADHEDVVTRAARAGLDCLCDKPLGPTAGSSQRMLEACVQSGVVLMVAFNQRYHPAHIEIARLLRHGEIGQVLAVKIDYIYFQPIASAGWRSQVERGCGGSVLDMAPHALDLGRFLLGRPLESLTVCIQRAQFGYPLGDGAGLVGKYDNETLGIFHVGYNYPDAYPRRILEVAGTHGMIVATNTMGQTKGGRVEVIRASGARSRLEFDRVASPYHAMLAAFADAVMNRRVDRESVLGEIADMELLGEALLQAGIEAIALPQ